MFSSFSSSNLYPTDRSKWSDEDGKKKEDPELIPLTDSSWEWEDEWHAEVVEGETDEEGWAYAFNFMLSTWYAEVKRKCHVRRQKWVRTRVLLTDEQLKVRDETRKRNRTSVIGGGDPASIEDAAAAQLRGAARAAPRTGDAPPPSGGKTDRAPLMAFSVEDELNELSLLLSEKEQERMRLEDLIHRQHEELMVLAGKLDEEVAVTEALQKDIKKKDTIIMTQTGSIFKLKKKIKKLEHENRLAVKETEEMLTNMSMHSTFSDPGHDDSSSAAPSAALSDYHRSETIISVPSYMTVESDSGKQHIEYVIELSTGRSFHRRYSQFRALHESLLKTTFGSVLPPFPPKVIFGSVNLDRRRFELDDYMRQVSSHGSLPEVNACLSFFLGLPSL